MSTEPQDVPEAWIPLPDVSALFSAMRAAGNPHPYDFGFLPAMARLIAAS
jgi:hypothetical protein